MTPPAGPMLFTAGRIAAVLGRDKRGVLRILRRTPATGRVLAPGGQMADAWAIQSLPANYQGELQRLANLKGCRNVEHLLSQGVERWKPSIPMAEIDGRYIDKAVRLKNALARALVLYANPEVEISEVRQSADEGYRNEFGMVSDRTVRRAFDRVVERDSGEERWDDLALYLDDRVTRKETKAAILPGLLGPHERAIFKYLDQVARPADPTIEELDLIWFAVCESLNEQVAAGEAPKLCCRRLIAFLQESAVALSKNSAALKKQLKRKFARYVSSGGDFNAMADQRPDKSGWMRAIVLGDEDRQLIVGHAAHNKGGRVASALRELRGAGKLSPVLEAHHIANPASKSYVPLSIRQQVQPDVLRLKNMVHGPRTHRLQGAYLTRDYSDVSAGDWYQADDVTLPVYFWEDEGEGAELMRGQFLIMMDVRTDFILGFLLISERNYDSLAVRSLTTICAAKHGLPRRGFYFENGLWKKSRIIAGSSNALPFDHADRGLRGLGMELRHARLPRGKVIERAIGQLQNRMEGLPGYVGRDERHDVRERVQRNFLDARAGRRPMNDCAYSKSEYCRVLGELVDDHNNETQQGRLEGMSPLEAWERLQGSEPRQAFANEWRYVLARDVRKIKVGRNGITLRYGRKSFIYHDAQTGKRVGEEVLAYFDPMLPDLLACTDLDRKNPFCIERANDVPAMDASDESIRAEQRKIDAHQEYARTLYWTSRNTLKSHNYISTIADAATVRMGDGIARESERIAARNDESAKRTRRNRDLIKSENLPAELLQSAGRRSPENVAALAKLLNQQKDTK